MPQKIKLKSRKEMADGTMAFHFEKPKGFTFTPGQAGDFTLIDPPETDAEGNKRSFSFASAPYEEDLFITTRMRDSAFKRSLKKIPLGTELDMDAPWGELTLHSDTSIPAVFLTGGIGITPVRSIVLQATHDKLAQRIIVFYSNHRPEDSAFIEELTNIQQQNPSFTLVPTMTGMGKSSLPWHGETCPIDEAMLKRSIDDLTLAIFYISGPPNMVSAMQKTLAGAGVKRDNIRAEDFTGY